MTTPSSRVALDAASPTSRASFRLIAKNIGATNREADRLRTALLARWVGVGGVYELERRLRALESQEADDTHEVDVLLAAWFASSESTDGHLVSSGDAVLAGLPDEVRTRLTSAVVEAPEPT